MHCERYMIGCKGLDASVLLQGRKAGRLLFWGGGLRCLLQAVHAEAGAGGLAITTPASTSSCTPSRPRATPCGRRRKASEKSQGRRSCCGGACVDASERLLFRRAVCPVLEHPELLEGHACDLVACVCGVRCAVLWCCALTRTRASQESIQKSSSRRVKPSLVPSPASTFGLIQGPLAATASHTYALTTALHP